jgi:DNA-binding NarL/FixJ family response regulator
MSIRVILVDNPASRLDSLRGIVSTQRDIQVIAEAGDGISAVRLAVEMKPQVVVMGMLIPGMNSFEATRRITKGHEEARIVILGNYTDEFIIKQVIEAGASHYLLWERAPQELPDAIRAGLAPE